MSAQALFVGDVTMDLTCMVDRIPGPDEKVHISASVEDVGGVVANAVVACSRSGADVQLACHVGDDPNGHLALERLRRRLAEVQGRLVPGRTARVVILLEGHGEKRLFLEPGDAFYPDDATLEALDLSATRWMHTAVYGRAAFGLTARCRTAGIPCSIDLEPATFSRGIETLAPVLDGAAIVFCNDKAARLIGPDPVATLFAMGVDTVIRSRGRDGVEWHDGQGVLQARSLEPVAVLDTTGAGDCLAGWLIGERLQGTSAESQLRRATAAATLSCAALGAQSSYPSRAGVDAHPVQIERR